MCTDNVRLAELHARPSFEKTDDGGAPAPRNSEDIVKGVRRYLQDVGVRDFKSPPKKIARSLANIRFFGHGHQFNRTAVIHYRRCAGCNDGASICPFPISLMMWSPFGQRLLFRSPYGIYGIRVSSAN
jgi:hypothetical protein